LISQAIHSSSLYLSPVELSSEGTLIYICTAPMAWRMLSSFKTFPEKGTCIQVQTHFWENGISETTSFTLAPGCVGYLTKSFSFDKVTPILIAHSGCWSTIIGENHSLGLSPTSLIMVRASILNNSFLLSSRCPHDIFLAVDNPIDFASRINSITLCL